MKSIIIICALMAPQVHSADPTIDNEDYRPANDTFLREDPTIDDEDYSPANDTFLREDPTIDNEYYSPANDTFLAFLREDPTIDNEYYSPANATFLAFLDLVMRTNAKICVLENALIQFINYFIAQNPYTRPASLYAKKLKTAICKLSAAGKELDIFFDDIGKKWPEIYKTESISRLRRHIDFPGVLDQLNKFETKFMNWYEGLLAKPYQHLVDLQKCISQERSRTPYEEGFNTSITILVHSYMLEAFHRRELSGKCLWRFRNALSEDESVIELGRKIFCAIL